MNLVRQAKHFVRDGSGLRLCNVVLAVLIVLYPFIGTFLGVDLGDTGYHYYAYEHLFTRPETISFTPFLTYLVGEMWLKLFGWLGLWGLNLLEFLLEITIVGLVYRTFSDLLGKTSTLFGLFLAIVASDTYLNIFNYHQFSVLLTTAVLICEYSAMVKNNVKYTAFAGSLFVLCVIARVGSVTVIVTTVLYWVWAVLHNAYSERARYNIARYLKCHAIAFALGAIVSAILVIAVLWVTGALNFFLNNLGRLRGLASESDSAYSFDRLLGIFLGGSLDALISGIVLFIGGVFAFLAVCYMRNRKKSLSQLSLSIVLGTLLAIIAIYVYRYSYEMNPVKHWPQMTTGPSFVFGSLVACAMIGTLMELSRENCDTRIVLLGLMAICLPLLTIAGSSTGTKHAAIALWLLFPLCVSMVRRFVTTCHVTKRENAWGAQIDRKAVCIGLLTTVIAFFIKYGDFVYRTFNFDSIDRSQLTATINNGAVRYLRTTEREASATEGVLSALEEVEKDRPLMVFGRALMLYTMSARESYVMPWVTNGTYSLESFRIDLKTNVQSGSRYPVVVLCRTNCDYGFSEQVYDTLLNAELRNNYGGKKKLIRFFLRNHKYGLAYMNDYYLLLTPVEDGSEPNFDYFSLIGT